MSERSGSRIEEARSRASAAKRRIGVVAAAGFVALVGLAYASHPGTASSSGAVSAGRSDDSLAESQGQFDFGYYGSSAPASGAAPQVQTSVS
jgi:hypothetical protein